MAVTLAVPADGRAAVERRGVDAADPVRDQRDITITDLGALRKIAGQQP